KVGTSSLRRQSQVLARRSDLVIEPIRGNIDTRLQKLRAGEYDAIILALAGLRRAGLFEAGTMQPLGLGELLAAAGQGALALQCGRDDGKTIELLSSLDDPDTHACVDLERALVLALKGDCYSPIAAQVSMNEEFIEFKAAVAGREGIPPIIRAKGYF